MKTSFIALLVLLSKGEMNDAFLLPGKVSSKLQKPCPNLYNFQNDDNEGSNPVAITAMTGALWAGSSGAGVLLEEARLNNHLSSNDASLQLLDKPHQILDLLHQILDALHQIIDTLAVIASHTSAIQENTESGLIVTSLSHVLGIHVSQEDVLFVLAVFFLGSYELLLQQEQAMTNVDDDKGTSV